MNKLYPLYTILLLCTCTTLSAQQWTRVYGSQGEDYAYSLLPTPDGGFVTAGTTMPDMIRTSTDYWIARFDANGEMLWDSTYGKPGVQETIFGFNSTREGGYMFGGFTNIQFSGAESALMYRIDSNGTEQWSVDIDYSSSDHWHFMIDRKNGGHYLGGHTDSKGDHRGDMWLVRLDSARRIIWEKTYDQNTGEHAHAGVETPDGGCLLLGHTSPELLEKYWVVKVDSNGAVQWQTTYGSSNDDHDSPYRIFPTKEGNYVLIGGSSGAHGGVRGQMWMLIIDSLGNIILNKHFGNASFDSFGWGGKQTSDGGFILSGYTNHNTHGSYDMYVVKTTANGTVEWEKRYGAEGDEIGYDVIETPDGYVVAGLVTSPSMMTGGNGDMMIVKINKANPNASAPLLTPDDAAITHRLRVNPVSRENYAMIELALAKPANGRVAIYNTLGEQVRTLAAGERFDAGFRGIEWDLTTDDGAMVPPGVYFYRLEIGGESGAGKIVVR